MVNLPVGTEFVAEKSAMVKFVKCIGENHNAADVAAGFSKKFEFYSSRGWVGAVCRPEFLNQLVRVRMDLINKVGGIEKAREIMSDYKVTEKNMTHVSDDGGFWCNENGNLIENIRSQLHRLNRIDDIRTAITEHDAPEFKVGDLVVLRDSPQEKVLKVQMFQDDFIRAFVGDSSDYSFGHKINFRHATPSEIQSGHRQPLGNPEQLDDVADIKYHVSPSCVVVNHD